MTANTRSATRHEVAIAVTAIVRGRTIASSLEQKLEGTIENLSVGGAFIHLGRRLTIGTPMTLRFEIPTHDHPIETDAIVRWSSEEGVGAQFEGLRAGHVFSIGKYLESL